MFFPVKRKFIFDPLNDKTIEKMNNVLLKRTVNNAKKISYLWISAVAIVVAKEASVQPMGFSRKKITIPSLVVLIL